MVVVAARDSSGPSHAAASGEAEPQTPAPDVAD
jgi:hypothetical protein